MSEITNYIPISRKLFEHQFWCEEREYSRFEAWIDLIQSARFEDTKKYIGNKVMPLKRGQIHATYRFLSERWKWSTKRVGGFFELLICEKMIAKETHMETGQTVITICNYDTYNIKPDFQKREGNSKETVRKREGNETNTDNNEKNVNNEIKNKKFITPADAEAQKPKEFSFAEKCRWFVDTFNEKKGSPGDSNKPASYKLTDKVEKSLQARLKEGYTAKQIFSAMDNMLKSKTHIESGFTYITPEFVLRADKINMYLNAGVVGVDKPKEVKLTKAQQRIIEQQKLRKAQ